MKYLEILQPEKTAGFPVDAIHSLASRLPQIGLSGYEEKDKLREEFIDLQVSACDLPPNTIKAADGSEKARGVGLFWQKWVS